jgi:hypothetical protein
MSRSRTPLAAAIPTVIESLTLGDDPSVPTGRRPWWFAVAAAAAVVASLAALAMAGDLDRREAGTLSRPPIPLEVLVLGDTSAGMHGCPDCFSYVDQLAVAMSEDGRRRIRIDDQTSAADRTPSSMPALLERLRTDPSTRAAVDIADVIVLAVGSGDVTPAPTTTRCHAERRSRCPEITISQFRYNLTAWIAETDHIRHQRPLVLRVITPPPTSGLPSQNHVARTACQIADAHRAACVNTYSLARSDEHVTTVNTDPLHPQLTQHGHDLVATRLIATGFL